MSKLAKQRGANYEREVCAFLTKMLCRKVERNLGQARDGGDDITVPPFRIECKRRRDFKGIYDFVSQVVATAKPGEIPTVVMRGDHQESLVVMRLRDAIPLIQQAVLMERLK